MKIMLDKGAIFPTRAHKLDAGMDLYSPYHLSVPGVRINLSGYDCSYQGEARIGSVTVDTGVHIQIPEGYVGFIKSKSGLNVNNGLTCEGVIDSGYTGSIQVKLYNNTERSYSFNRGDKIAQLVILPCLLPELEVVDELDATERGNGGFGSTGR